jgi:hypothetical protein
MKFLPVMGTEGLQDDPDPRRRANWWRAGSPVLAHLAARGLAALHPEDPFVWSTELGGVHWWARVAGSRQDARMWLVGGKALRWWLVAKAVPLEDRTLIVHSHGLQPVLYAAAEWHEPRMLRRLVTIGSPLRADVIADVGPAAIARLGSWLHVSDADHDFIAAFGRFGDGAKGSGRVPPNVQVLRVPGIGHEQLLTDSTLFPLWDPLVAFLQEPTP